VVAQMCDEVAVMYLGRIIERAAVDDMFYDPKHPYTISLAAFDSASRYCPRSETRIDQGVVCPIRIRPYPVARSIRVARQPSPVLCDTVMPEEIFVAGSQTHTVRCHLYT